MTCGHKFIDSNECLKCGWVPNPVCAPPHIPDFTAVATIGGATPPEAPHSPQPVTREHRVAALKAFGWGDVVGTKNSLAGWVETGIYDEDTFFCGDTLPKVAQGIADAEARGASAALAKLQVPDSPSHDAWWGVWCERDGAGFWRDDDLNKSPLRTTRTDAERRARNLNVGQETRTDSVGWKYEARAWALDRPPLLQVDVTALPKREPSFAMVGGRAVEAPDSPSARRCRKCNDSFEKCQASKCCIGCNHPPPASAPDRPSLEEDLRVASTGIGWSGVERCRQAFAALDRVRAALGIKPTHMTAVKVSEVSGSLEADLDTLSNRALGWEYHMAARAARLRIGAALAERDRAIAGLKSRNHELRKQLRASRQGDDPYFYALANAIDEKLGWRNEEAEEAGDYPGRIAQVAGELLAVNTNLTAERMAHAATRAERDSLLARLGEKELEVADLEKIRASREFWASRAGDLVSERDALLVRVGELESERVHLLEGARLLMRPAPADTSAFDVWIRAERARLAAEKAGSR